MALYDLRRHHALGARTVKERLPGSELEKCDITIWPTIDYTETPFQIYFVPKGDDQPLARHHDSETIVVVLQKGRSEGETEYVTIRIPWSYVCLRYGDHMEPPAPLERMAGIMSDVHPRNPGNVQLEKVDDGLMVDDGLPDAAVPDEVDVLVNTIHQEHQQNPDPTKHIWERVEELTSQVRRPECWPFPNCGPFSPSDLIMEA